MLKRNIRILMGLLLLGAGIVLFILVANNASAATLTVDDDGNAEYTKIQDAIDAAEDGDTIGVWEGTYYENVVVDKTVSLIGNGSEETTIDGGNSRTVVKITEGFVNISGFNITGSGGGSYDAGVEITSNNNRIFQNILVNNTHGILIRYGDKNEVKNNILPWNMINGIYLFSAEKNNVTGNVINGSYLGGINLYSSNNNVFEENHLQNTGFIIIGTQLRHWNTHTIRISNQVNEKPMRYLANVTDSEIVENTGQIILANCSRIDIRDFDMLQKNGGIQVGFSSQIIVDNNTLKESYYGIQLYQSQEVTVVNNTCKTLWNGIRIEYSDNCTISGNTCAGNVNGIEIENSNFNNILNNTCKLCKDDGFYIRESKNNTISGSISESNEGRGILLLLCDNSTLENLWIYDNKEEYLSRNPCTLQYKIVITQQMNGRALG